MKMLGKLAFWIDEREDKQVVFCNRCGKAEKHEHYCLVTDYVCRACAGATKNMNFCDIVSSWEECGATCNQCR